ncbi:MAG TPA: phage tail protein, partial [Candidatus Limnocylindria bacterium]|nr:phage tail protein [Candidatus Limnocylindria bacterium]
MRRVRFLSTGAAAILAGCGGRTGQSALPRTSAVAQTHPPSGAVRLVPTVADAIPQSVLASPIIGEARRFDGASAPANWLLCQGQTLTIANYRALF